MGRWTNREAVDAETLARRLAGRTHGTPSTYHAGCREACCREAVARSARRYRKRKAAVAS